MTYVRAWVPVRLGPWHHACGDAQSRLIGLEWSVAVPTLVCKACVMGQPTRVKTMLRRAGVHDIAELEDLFEHDIVSLFSIPGLGDRSLAHIQHAIDGYYGRSPGYRRWQGAGGADRTRPLRSRSWRTSGDPVAPYDSQRDNLSQARLVVAPLCRNERDLQEATLGCREILCSQIWSTNRPRKPKFRNATKNTWPSRSVNASRGGGVACSPPSSVAHSFS